MKDEVDTLELDTSVNLSTHILDTSTHGVDGYIVGTSDAQILSNKTYSLGTANRALQTDYIGNLEISTITSTELSQLSGIASNIQTQLDSDALDLQDHISDSFNVHGVDGYVVGTEGEQTLFDKTLNNPQIDGYLDMEELSVSPDSPPSGRKLIYPKDDGILYTKNSAGEEVPVGSGAGQGRIEYTENGTFEVNANGWTAGSDATFIRSTSSPLIGDASGLLTNTTASARTILTGDINTIDSFYIATSQQINASLKYDLESTAAEGDYVYEIWNETDDEAILSTQVELKPGQNHIYVNFIALAGKVYKHRIRDVSGTNGDTLKIDEVSCTPETRVVGSAGGWKQYDIGPSGLNIITSSDATISAVNNAKAQPRKDPITGKWLMWFAVDIDISSAQQLVNLNISGVTSIAADQACYADAGSNTAAGALWRQSSGNVQKRGVSSTRVVVSGTVELESKPTWADFDGTVDMLTASRVQENARVGYRNSATSLGSAATIPFDVLLANTEVLGSFQNTGGEITVPVDGTYQISGRLRVPSNDGLRTIELQVDRGSGFNLERSLGNQIDPVEYLWCVELFLKAGDKLRIRSNGSFGTLAVIDSGSYLNISRISDRSADSGLGYGLANKDSMGLRKEVRLAAGYSATNQDSLSSGSFHLVEFDSEEFDDSGIYDNVTNYRIQPDLAGKYRITWNVRINSSTANTLRYVQASLFKNGVEHKKGIGGGGHGSTAFLTEWFCGVERLLNCASFGGLRLLKCASGLSSF